MTNICFDASGLLRYGTRDATQHIVHSLAQFMIRLLLKELTENKCEKRKATRFRTGILYNTASKTFVDTKSSTCGWLNNHIGQHERFDRPQGIMSRRTAQDSQHLWMRMAMMQMIAPDCRQYPERTLLSGVIQSRQELIRHVRILRRE